MDNADRMIVIYTTFANEQEARTLGRELVSKKLCACVNIYPQIWSIYSWQGEIAETQEVVMLVKTKGGLKDRALSFLSAHHPYSVPALFVLEPTHVSPPYLQWMLAQTQA